jgi:hypothetical protein
MLVNSQSHEETELLQKRPLKEDIFDVLHEKIISGTYKPGDWLRQDDRDWICSFQRAWQSESPIGACVCGKCPPGM